MQNSPFIKALSGKNHGSIPIWLMRQAGRYIPAYQELRKKHRLVDMFHNPELVVKVTMLPVELLEVDAAILFQDILSVLDGLGIEWDFKDGVGPIVQRKKFERRFGVYEHVRKAILDLKRKLKVPLIGFAGAPFTVASYLVEGGSSRDLKKTKIMAFSEREKFSQLLDEICEATCDYLQVQIEAGVDAIQLFDSWANHLSDSDAEDFSRTYLKRIRERFPTTQMIFFAKGTDEKLVPLKPEAISVDWTRNIKDVRKKIPSTIALQGNLDPMVLLSDRESIRRHVDYIVLKDSGYIFNLGHGILPDTPFENVKFLVDYVRSNCRTQ